MGRIIQLTHESEILKYEKLPLNITNWRTVQEGIIDNTKIIKVCVDLYIFIIYNIDLKQFLEISNTNIKKPYDYIYQNSALPCSHCLGKGYVDWITRITKNFKEGHSIFNYQNKSFKYYRNKKGAVNIFISTSNKPPLYTSTSIIKRGEELCPVCYGSGIRVNHYKYSETTFLELDLKGI